MRPRLHWLVALQAAAGLAFELVARALDWWRFPSLAHVAAQALLFWGLAMGAVTWGVAPRPRAARWLAGALVGGAAEAVNVLALGIWSFPQERVWGLSARGMGIVALAAAWGLLPLLAPEVLRALGKGTEGKGAGG